MENMPPVTLLKSEIQNCKEIDQLNNIDKNIKKEVLSMASLILKDNDYFESSIEKQIHMSSKKILTFQKRMIPNKNLQEFSISPKSLNSKETMIEEVSLCRFSEDTTDFNSSRTPQIQNSKSNHDEILLRENPKFSESQTNPFNSRSKRNLLPLIKDSKQTTMNPKISENPLEKLESKMTLNNHNNWTSKQKIKLFRIQKNIKVEAMKNEKHPTNLILNMSD